MANSNVSQNNTPILYAKNSVGGLATYVTATNNKLDVNATASLAGTALPISGATTAVGVAIVDGSGNQITSFGGGTQYANGSAQATPTGTVALGYDGANVRALLTSNTGQLAVTANAGTNLNTSALALDATLTGGTQKTKIVDGSGNVIASTSNALNVSVQNSTLAVTQSGSWTVDTELPAAAALADGASNPTVPGVGAFGMVYNGATWERMRGDLGDGSSPTGVIVNSALLYNGTTYDRARGDTTSGMWVNVKNSSLTVAQSTAANLNATVVGTGTFAVQSSLTAPTTIFNGKTTVATAGTRVTLAASQTVKSVTIKALATNTGTIYVGSSTVAASNGLQLAAGEAVSMDIANLNTVNIDSSVNGEGVTYAAVS